MLIKPYKNNPGIKKEQVAVMFDNIAGKYDFMNHFFSLGIDILWRKKAISIVAKENPGNILDVATGTGDLALEAYAQTKAEITGIDISAGMLEIAKKKISEKGFGEKIKIVQADSENMPFENASFDAVTVAFGVRNFENLDKGLSEMYRILKPGGLAVILEFSKPTAFPFKQLYNFYFKNILPSIGKIFSDDKQAYT
ncbi:MAG: bifunctional demethylmenaquinone methyltransferase/2-methoxy-6-polyprenyl-1,4-benzoquinol methylase UbiE, partial [Nitrosopumilus sp.]|nr:bifunctional demethylmenaquinone methyltransferase/2-methoxy-6-polyprenyl-1,4-benzoquinol methylase UbiE [Nitrosopumilus sp.]